MLVFELWVHQQKKKEPSFLLQPHITVRLKAYFVTCMRVLRKELDTGASSGEVTDCVIVSKLNNQYSSACWDNTIIHLSIVEDYRQRDISLCLLPKCPTLEILKIAEKEGLFRKWENPYVKCKILNIKLIKKGGKNVCHSMLISWKAFPRKWKSYLLNVSVVVHMTWSIIHMYQI